MRRGLAKLRVGDLAALATVGEENNHDMEGWLAVGDVGRDRGVSLGNSLAGHPPLGVFSTSPAPSSGIKQAITRPWKHRYLQNGVGALRWGFRNTMGLHSRTKLCLPG